MRAVWGVLVRDFFQKRIREDSTVLDIGAGPCLFINQIQARRRIALDANSDVRGQAGQGVEALVTEDLSLREIGDETIDYVFLSNFLEHLPDYLAVLDLLTRIHRKLKHGGSLLVLRPNYRLAASRYFDFIDHSMILTEASLLEALTAVGFQIKELKTRFLSFEQVTDAAVALAGGCVSSFAPRSVVVRQADIRRGYDASTRIDVGMIAKIAMGRPAASSPP